MSLLKERNRDCSDLLNNGRGNRRTRHLNNTHLPIVFPQLRDAGGRAETKPGRR